MSSRRAVIATLAMAAAGVFGLAPVSDDMTRDQAEPNIVATSARDSVIEARTRRLADELRCPVCQGVSIGASPTELAQEMTAVIRDQLRAGKSPDEVREYFVSKYGEWILLEPKPEGLNLAVYLLPLLVLGIGGVVVFMAIRRWTTNPRAADATEEDSVRRELEEHVG